MEPSIQLFGCGKGKPFARLCIDQVGKRLWRQVCLILDVHVCAQQVVVQQALTEGRTVHLDPKEGFEDIADPKLVDPQVAQVAGDKACGFWIWKGIRQEASMHFEKTQMGRTSVRHRNVEEVTLLAAPVGPADKIRSGVPEQIRAPLGSQKGAGLIR